MAKQLRLARQSKDNARAALNELRKRGVGLNLLDKAFPAQRAFIDDSSRLKTALCTRRSGKTMAAGLYLVNDCITKPGTTCLYIALTRASAEQIMFPHILKPINKEYGLGMVFNHSTLTVKFPNGSLLYLIGGDAKPEESAKVLGQKFSLVIIDESASFTQDLRDMIYSHLKPATADQAGTICMIGTPSNNVKSLFYDVTTGKEPGWSNHTWTAYDNPHMAAQWQIEIDDYFARNPDAESEARFQQMYRGMWSVDEDARVYRYNHKINIQYAPLPEGLDYILSVDLGFIDATAFVVAAYSKYDPHFYVVEAYKLKGLDIPDAVAHIVALKERYNPKTIICDSLAIQTIVTIRQRYGLPIQTPAAHKFKKMDHINLMNGDFLTGRIKIWKECVQLTEEYSSIIFDERSQTPQIHRNSEDDLADSVLYAWRMSRHYAYESRPTIIDPYSEEAMDAWWDAQDTKKEDDNFVSRDWGDQFESY